MKTALILTGSSGARLQNDMPKGMMEINGKTLLQWQIDYLAGEGFDTVIICAGHNHDLLKWETPSGLRVLKVIESEPLGTGGAVKNAFNILGDYFANGAYVVNVDDLCQIKEVMNRVEQGKNFIFTKKIPYSVWVDGIMFSQNEGEQHIGHTFLTFGVVHDLPERCSLEKHLAMLSKQGSVQTLPVDEKWVTVNNPGQLEKARREWN